MEPIQVTTQKPATPPPFRGQMSLPAGFWARFCALLFDGAFVGIVSQLITAGLMRGAMPPDTPPQAKSLLSLLITMTLTALYFGISYPWKGTTLGKYIMGIKVYRHGTKDKIGFFRAIWREIFAKFISGILLSIGYFMAGFRKDKRALHDFMAGTDVMKVEKTRAPWAIAGVVVVLLNGAYSGMHAAETFKKNLTAQLNQDSMKALEEAQNKGLAQQQAQEQTAQAQPAQAQAPAAQMAQPERVPAQEHQ